MEVVNSKLFTFMVWVLLLFVIIFIGKEITFIFAPITVFAKVLFLPIMLALVLYYLLSPLITWLVVRKVNRTWAILIIYAVFTLSGFILFITIGSLAYQQFGDLLSRLPDYIEKLAASVASLEDTYLFQRLQHKGVLSVANLAESLSQTVLASLPEFGTGVSVIASLVSNTLLVFILLPLILFYMLQDGEQFLSQVIHYIPKKYRKKVKSVFKEIDQGLSSYITGHLIVSVTVGVLVYIGFLIVGLNHSLILALFAMLANFIPYLGPLIGTIPAVIVGFVTSTVMGAQVLLVVTIVQQIESFFLIPQIMGRKLVMHPLSIIFMLIIVGSLTGIIGLILAMPILVILKIIFSHLFELFKRKTDLME